MLPIRRLCMRVTTSHMELAMSPKIEGENCPLLEVHMVSTQIEDQQSSIAEEEIQRA